MALNLAMEPNMENTGGMSNASFLNTNFDISSEIKQKLFERLFFIMFYLKCIVIVLQCNSEHKWREREKEARRADTLALLDGTLEVNPYFSFSLLTFR